ncbi:hypothetical protein PTKIN_Ptkin03bG0077200 [Pterospermum kingtungense]
MSHPGLIRSPPVTRRTEISLPEDPKKERKGRKVGEVVGGSVAEGAAVCCCLPCTVMELIVLSLYKVPTGLCRKAWKGTKRRRLQKKKKKNQGLLGPSKGASTKVELESELSRTMAGKGDAQDDGCTGAVDLDKEMCDRFYGTGFWRSPSQIET